MLNVIIHFKIIILLILIFIPDSHSQSLLFLGDSLTEGYGLDITQAYPSQLEKKLKNIGYKNIKIVNAGLSGATTASGLSRLKWYLKNRPDYVFVALGANDGLRGLDLSSSYKNFEKIIEAILDQKIKIILLGMKVPPNYGKEYSKKFEQNYVVLAKKYNLDLYPFLLKDVAGIKELNQADGIHPNEKGQEKISENLVKWIVEKKVFKK